MSEHRRGANRAGISAIVCMLVLGTGHCAFSQNVEVVADATRRDSVIGNSANCTIETDGGTGTSIGHVGRGDAIRISDLQFPQGKLMTIKIRYSSASAGYIDFMLNSMDGMYFNQCAFAVTGGFYNWTTIECAVPLEVQALDLSGPRDLFAQFFGGGAFGEGVIQLKSFTFVFDVSDVGVKPETRRMQSSTRHRGGLAAQVVMSRRTAGADGRRFDIRGRAILASEHQRAGVGGIVITADR